MAGKLILDPTGAATTLTLEGAVVRVLMDRTEEHPRHTMVGNAAAQTRDLYATDYATGTLSLLLSSADVITFHGWMTSLCGGTHLDVYLNASGSADERVVLFGETIVERYEWQGPSFWRITLPVRRIA